MIADSHAHAWPSWPYAPPAHECDTDALLATLDANGVDRALVVAARLDGQANNNDYVLEAARRHPDRLWAAVEVGAFFAPRDSSARQLSALLDAGPVACVALFPDPASPGWLAGEAGQAVLAVTERHGLAVSVAAPPPLHDDVRAAARAWPSIRFMAHHAGMVQPGELESVLSLASEPNVFVKLSGLHYWAGEPEVLVGALLAAFGPSRLVWGSDFPAAARRGVGFTDSLQAARSLVPVEYHAPVLGDTLAGLLLG